MILLLSFFISLNELKLVTLAVVISRILWLCLNLIIICIVDDFISFVDYLDLMIHLEVLVNDLIVSFNNAWYTIDNLVGGNFLHSIFTLT